MTWALDMISKSVHVKQQVSTVTPPTKPFQSQLQPTLPQPYDGSCASGKNFIHACQTYFQLRPDQFPDDQAKVQWAMTYMSRDRAQKWVTRIYNWEMLLANAGVNYIFHRLGQLPSVFLEGVLPPSCGSSSHECVRRNRLLPRHPECR